VRQSLQPHTAMLCNAHTHLLGCSTLLRLRCSVGSHCWALGTGVVESAPRVGTSCTACVASPRIT
jgi:hypothetical protein